MSDGNHKEVHNHYANGSVKVVWAWAGFATLIVVAIIGFTAAQQWQTNDKVAEALTNLAVRVGQMETKIEQLENALRDRE